MPATNIPHELQLIARKAACIAYRRQNILTLDEIESAALEGVWQALRKHDSSRGPIEPFAYNCATSRIKDLIRDESRRRRRGVYQFPENDKGETWEPAAKPVVPESARADFWRAIERGLSQRQAQAIRLIYRDGLSQEAAARRLGISRSRVSETIKTARQRLRPVVKAWA